MDNYIAQESNIVDFWSRATKVDNLTFGFGEVAEFESRLLKKK